MRIAVLTGASLAWNPRAFKEASALARAGHEVSVIGSGWDLGRLSADIALARDSGFEFVSALQPTSHIRIAAARARGKIGKVLFSTLQLETAWQLGPLAGSILRAALHSNADYFVAHSEQGAWAASRLLQAGFKVGIDMEDWFSEDLLPEARTQRPVRLLRTLEKTLLRGARHSTCPSRAMSAALVNAYGCRTPAVVYNAFPWSDREKLDGVRKDRRTPGVVSIHWVSQVLGPGRGLEDLFRALPMIEGAVEIHLRGFRLPSFEKWLGTSVPAGFHDRILVHEPVGVHELLSRIAEHDIGFAGEMKYCASRDLTVTNKILHYLLGGCAVVASDTAGQKEIATAAPRAISLYPSGDSNALARELNALVGSRERLGQARSEALDAAKRTFSWEHQEKTLLESVSGAASSGEPAL